MSFSHMAEHQSIPETSTSHPENPVPEEPIEIPYRKLSLKMPYNSPHSSSQSLNFTSSSDSGSPTTPQTDTELSDLFDQVADKTTLVDTPPAPKHSRIRRASTVLISKSPEDVQRILGEGGTNLIERDAAPLPLPDNDAFRSLHLRLAPLSMDTELSKIVDLPEETVSFENIPAKATGSKSAPQTHPPEFVTPHPPYAVHSAKIHHARALTKPGAEKRTYHFDIDVTDYPEESGDVDFVVGGAIGVCAPNSDDLVDDVFDTLN
ncbi:MAG: hypothetical protein Q9187_008676, partial [Circinaria calcarea]